MSKFDKILIVRTDRMGDVILTTPAIKALRKAYPLAHLTILITPATRDLVEGNPYLDEILMDERQGRHQGWLGFLRLVGDIRSGKFDVAFIFHTKRRYNLACFLAGVPRRIGYKNEKYGFLLTEALKDSRHLGQKHEAQYCLDVLKSVGIENLDLDFFVPIHKEAEDWAHHWLSSQGLSDHGMIAIHPGSSDPAKCWPLKHFVDLIDALDRRYHIKIVLIGSAATIERSGEIIQAAHEKPFNLTGQTSLAQTVSLLRRCRLLISNDSGPVHIASAVGIHVISLFTRNQPGINPERWKPLSDKGVYLFNPHGISVDQVLDEVERIFHKDHQQSFYW